MASTSFLKAKSELPLAAKSLNDKTRQSIQDFLKSLTAIEDYDYSLAGI